MSLFLRFFSRGRVFLLVALAMVLNGLPLRADELPRYDPSIRNVRMLTQNPDHLSPWDNAEAYFSPDGKSLIFQASRAPSLCDAIYTMDLSGKNVRMVSSGKGRCTCSSTRALSGRVRNVHRGRP